MGAAPEADKALYVGNLDPKVTEELLFELFLQAGPLLKVKIPKDKDGKPKQFGFVNFKHEESVPYGMNLLNGIKLFGRPLKIQFRSGSSHGSQEGKSPSHLQNTSCSPSPSNTPSPNLNRFDRSVDGLMSPVAFTTPQVQLQRSFSSPDSLQRQAVMNSHSIRQQQFNGMSSPLLQAHPDFTSPMPPSLSLPPSQHSMSLPSDPTPGQRKSRQRSLPYQQDSRQFSPEQRFGEPSSDRSYRGNRDDYHDDRYHDDRYHDDRYHDDRSPNGWSRDYDHRRESPRDGRWRSSRH